MRSGRDEESSGVTTPPARSVAKMEMAFSALRSFSAEEREMIEDMRLMRSMYSPAKLAAIQQQRAQHGFLCLLVVRG